MRILDAVVEDAGDCLGILMARGSHHGRSLDGHGTLRPTSSR
jgi:hypothetical protein